MPWYKALLLRNGGYIIMEREKFSSRLGFILISAGCAIGLGNVWRFPYIVGEYGGAAFVLVYLVFLLGLPIVIMEFAVGRASRKSAAVSFDVLEPKGSRWHLTKYPAMAGNYILMMFYTTVGGWMLLYFFKMLMGDFTGLEAEAVAGESGAYGQLYGGSGAAVFWRVRHGPSAGGGAHYQGHEGVPAGTDGRAGCPLHDPSGRRSGTGILPEA